MPKRVSTPPPDWKSEPKYFTIYQPYPIHANMELDTDRKLLCFWIACILGDPKYLFALFHKPSSPNMVIIEVDRSCPSYERLLGEHKWSEFLLQPHCDEVARSSKIYYSRWSHARGVEKNGWKRKMVEDAWFNTWLLHNSVLKYPYPGTHRCGLPPEDITNEPLCRALPVALFPPPPAPKLPPAGSAEWLAAKKKNSVPKAPPTVGGVQAPKNMQKDKAGPPGERGDVHLWGISPPSRSSSGSSDDRSLATPSPTSVCIVLEQPQDVSPAIIPAGDSLWDIGAPPGLVHPSKRADLAPPLNEQEDYFPCVMLSEPVGSPMDAEAYADYTADWQLGPDVLEAADMAPRPVDPGENLWGGYGEQDSGSEPEELCPAHGATCSKGICKERARIIKEKERREREAAQAQRGRGRGRGRGAGSNRGRGFKSNSRVTGNLSTAKTWRVPQPVSTPNSGSGSVSSSDSSESNRSSATSGGKGWGVGSAVSKTPWDVQSGKTQISAVQRSPSSDASGIKQGDGWTTKSARNKAPWAIKPSETRIGAMNSVTTSDSSNVNGGDRGATGSAVSKMSWGVQTNQVPGNPVAPQSSTASVASDRWATDSVVGTTPWDVQGIQGVLGPTATQSSAASVASDRWATESVVGKTPWDAESVQGATAPSTAVSEVPDRWATESAVGPTPWDIQPSSGGKRPSETSHRPVKSAGKASWADLVDQEFPLTPASSSNKNKKKKNAKASSSKPQPVVSRAPSVAGSGWGDVPKTPWS